MQNDSTAQFVLQFQERVLAAQALSDRVRSTGQRLAINSDGSIALFHSTSADHAAAIAREAQFKGNTWFAASKAESLRHAKPKHGRLTVTLEIRLDARDVEFSTGTGEFYAPDGLTRNEHGLWVDPKQCIEDANTESGQAPTALS